MKICILSMQDVENYGSLLQAYSLKQMLEEFGHSIQFLHIQTNSAENELVGHAEEFVEDHDYLGLFSKIKKVDKYFFNRIRNKLATHKQFLFLDDFRNKHLPSDNGEKYDLCVIGSDEVFNCMLKSKWGFTSQLFGNVKEANEVITYAASCGSTLVGNVPEKMKIVIRKSFERISAFSVRDENTESFVRELSINQNIHINMDPVVVADFDSLIDQEELPVNFPKRCMIVYSYPNRFHDETEIELIKQFAISNGLEIVSLGGYQMWIDKPYALTPFQLLNAFKYAEFVITDTFHGTIFAAKYSKAYGVLTRPSNYNKLSDLVNRLGIQDHLMNSIDEIDSKYLMPKTDISEIIRVEREKTLDYLRQYCKE